LDAVSGARVPLLRRGEEMTADFMAVSQLTRLRLP
jgi:hypothetical protein